MIHQPGLSVLETKSILERRIFFGWSRGAALELAATR
jgi:hypothetical protein